MARRIKNEEELFDMLQRLPDVEPQMIDLAALALLDQIALMAETDVLIGADILPS